LVDRQRAWRLRDGEVQLELSPAAGADLVARIGLPVPPPAQ
jgi:hypothetical protein